MTPDAAASPKRGMTVQYHETDIAFLKRLLAEEGLFCWFEHQSEDGDTLGKHTLVIADHKLTTQADSIIDRRTHLRKEARQHLVGKETARSLFRGNLCGGGIGNAAKKRQWGY